MHNVKRVDYEAVSQAEREKKLQKIKHYSKLCKVVLNAHKEGVYSTNMFELTGNLIEINPDFYSLWNYRRESVIRMLQAAPEDKKKLSLNELKLSESALRKNPKSYYAWHHRRWMIAKGTVDLVTELALCTKYLGMDSRNFHCWNYRRYVMMVSKPPLKEELRFSSSKIDDNFSNYSAWHHRSFIIPKLLESADKVEIKKLVTEEFELLQQAFFTDPGDQSSWLYHRWLLGQVVGLGVKPDKKETMRVVINEKSEQIKVLKREMSMVEELLEVEPECKWALLTLALLIEGLQMHGLESEDYKERTKKIFNDLKSLDPFRENYYLDMYSRVKKSTQK